MSMFTDAALQVAREVMLVGGAIAVILLCFVLISCLRILSRVSRMSQDVEELVEKVLGLLLQPLSWLHSKLLQEKESSDNSDGN